MNATPAGPRIEPRGVTGEFRDDPRGPDERDIADDAKAAGPPRQLADNLKPAILYQSQFAVSAVGDPNLSIPKPRRMWPRQAGADRLASDPGKDDTAAIHGILLVPGAKSA